jgi:WD40 repeat protein
VQILKGPRKTVFNLAFSPDGHRLAAACHREVHLWDLDAGTLRYTWPLPDYSGAVAFSPDQQYLAVTSWLPGYSATNRLLVWRLATPQAPILNVPGGYRALWFHPDGSWLLVQNDDFRLARWDTTDWTEWPVWEAGGGWNDDRYCHISISPDAHTLGRQLNRALELYNLGTGDLRRTIPRPAPLEIKGAFLPDGRHFVTAQENELVVLDLVEGKEVVRRKSGRRRFLRLVGSPDGRWVLAAPSGKAVHSWSGLDWGERQAYSFPVGDVCCLAVDGTGQRAAAGGSSGQVVLWDLD